MQIAFLGDSLTWGGYGGNFVAEVATRLPAHDIINAGEAGNTVLHLLNRLDGVLRREPDGIFIMVGSNDAIAYSQPETHTYYRAQGVPGGYVTPEMFAQSYRELLSRIPLADIKAWVGLPPMEYNPGTVAAMRQFNALAREVAELFNVPVLDLMAALTPAKIPQRRSLRLQDINDIGRRIETGWHDYEQESQLGGFTYSFDGVHLMPETAQQVAEMMVEFMGLESS